MTTTPGPRPPGAHAFAVALALVAAGLLGWACLLGLALPATHVVTRWSTAWAGYDLLLAGLFAATAWLTHRRDPLAPSVGLATALALVVDAWWDCTTSTGVGLAAAGAMAVVEVGTAAVLARWAVHRARSTKPLPTSPDLS